MRGSVCHGTVLYGGERRGTEKDRRYAIVQAGYGVVRYGQVGRSTARHGTNIKIVIIN